MAKVYHAVEPYQPRRYKHFPPAKPGHKYCVDCEQEKPFKDFHKMQGSYRPTCKMCRKAHESRPIVIIQLPLFLLSKVCTKCGNERELDEFDVDQNGKAERFCQCKQCRSDYNREFRKENLERFAEYDHARNRTPERKAQKMKRHQERSITDPQYLEAIRQQRKKQYQKYPERARDFYPRRRARILNATVGIVSYAHILERDGYICHICQKPIDPDAKKRSSKSLSFDHIIPLHPRPGEPQGTHSEENLKPAHYGCNVRKGNRPFEVLTSFDRRGVE